LFLASLTVVACAADDGAGTGTDADATTSEGSGDPTAADTTEGEGSTTGAPPDVSGEEFYLSVCAPCHGNEGEGTALGYALQHPVRDYSTWVVRNGRPMGNPELPGSVMNAYSVETLPDQTLEEIWDYLDAPPQPTTGEGLYLDYCRNCHGEDATGGITGVSILTAEAMLELFEKVREGENMGLYQLRNEAMPRFDQSRISDDEVQLIANYLATL
jgi:mono/diheme cytochrome c family protein